MKTFELCSAKAGCLTPGAVDALKSMLERLPSCTELRINTMTPSVATQLLPALRNTAVQAIGLGHQQMTDCQLLAWCAGQAGRPMIVKLWDCRLNGRLARVRQVLQEGGSDVRLVCSSGVVDDDAMGGGYHHHGAD
jgi:hypothetical protein